MSPPCWGRIRHAQSGGAVAWDEVNRKIRVREQGVSSELHGAKDGDLTRGCPVVNKDGTQLQLGLYLLDLSVSRVGSVPQKHIESS